MMNKKQTKTSSFQPDNRPVDGLSGETASKSKGIVKGTKGFLPVIFSMIMVVSLIFLWRFNRSSDAAPAKAGSPKAPMVAVTTISEQEVNPPQEYVGWIEAIQAVDLRARVKGYLEEVKFREGSDVRAGDLLYVIEQAPYQAIVNEYRAKVAEAEANLTRTRQYLHRLQAVRSGGVSESDLEAAVSAELQAEAQLQEAKANLEQAELDLSYTKITAPISGRIGRTSFTRGNLIGPESGPLARIVQMDPIRVVYAISDSDFANARFAGEAASETGGQVICPQKTRLQLSGNIMYPETGRKDFVDNQVDPHTGTIAVRAIFDNPQEILLPGQYVTVLINCVQGKRALMVPQSAVQEDREGRFVFVVNGEKKVVQRRIATGKVIGGKWMVESGLAPGESVIVQGVQKVRPGQTVETIADTEQSRG